MTETVIDQFLRNLKETPSSDWRYDPNRNWEVDPDRNWKIDKNRNWEIDTDRNWKIDPHRNPSGYLKEQYKLLIKYLGKYLED